MSAKPASVFMPYANEADVIEIGNLAIENRLDRITLAGDVDLTRDKPGLARARLLHRLLGDVVAALRHLDDGQSRGKVLVLPFQDPLMAPAADRR